MRRYPLRFWNRKDAQHPRRVSRFSALLSQKFWDENELVSTRTSSVSAATASLRSASVVGYVPAE